MANDFHGLPIDALENRFLRLEYLKTAGPRIVRLYLAGSDHNPLVELPDFSFDTPYGPFFLRGGHRLWRAPETLADTYVPDDDGLVVEAGDGRVSLTMPASRGRGISKRVALQLAPDRASVTVEHVIGNEASAAVELSAWALTMCKQGGTVILPQAQGPTDPQGLLSNRHLVLWPYTSWQDPRLVLRDEVILIRAQPALPPLKIGCFNPHGWMGYWSEGLLFVKRYPVAAEAPHPDRDCNTESYCNDQFVELETLGPLTRLAPGQSVTHTEIWDLYNSLDQPFITPAVRALIGT